MSDTAIKVENLSKLYRIGMREKRHDTFSGAFTAWLKSPWTNYRRLHKLTHFGDSPGLQSPVFGQHAPVTRPHSSASEETDLIWALKGVCFEIKQGEVLGIIGRNGAGKSTLLKVLSRITEPTSGRAIIQGRIASLLEVGTGFHPELTGRENIYLNGTILGMTRVEVDMKFDEIVDFAEIEKFIDTPVKHYSTGMYVRLAFAVAAHLEPEILLVDEVLAVGDASFQKKCLGKMGDVATEGRTVLFVSHNMAAVEGLCSRGLLIDSGKIIKDDVITKVLEEYSQRVLPAITTMPLDSRSDRSGTGAVRLTGFRILDAEGRNTAALRSGHDAVFAFDYEATENNTRSVDVGFGLYSVTGQLLFVLYSSYVGQEFNAIPRRGTFKCKIPQLPLSPGMYRVGARVTVGSEEADWPRDGIGYVNVETADFYRTGKVGFGNNCPLLVSGRWVINEL